MGLQKCGLSVNSEGREIQTHGTFEFPCAGYSAVYTNAPKDVIPWHWHEELEVAYVKSGSIQVQVPGKQYLLNTGDCIVINSNIPHHAVAKDQCDLRSLVFHPLLITGNNISVFAQKYMAPLVSCSSLDSFQPKTACDQAIAENFQIAFEALVHDVPGLEFVVREHLSLICFYLWQQIRHTAPMEALAAHHDTIRIREMLEYIHANYADDITLADIARTANIGERECLRCFQRTIQLSPMQYLLKYRVMQGAVLLETERTKTISEISGLCGFDSPSNFAKMFKRFYGCSPREYRRKNNAM